VEAELVALAAAGATAFVEQMATDSWEQVRDRIVSFFSRRGDAEEEVVEEELELLRGELTEALSSGDEQTASDVQAEWRTRLRRALLADPSAAAELRSVLDELGVSPGTQHVVHNSISGGVQHAPVIQSGSVGIVNQHR
jgi:hypothetical protein